MLTISGVTKSFGGRTLFEDVSLQINRNDRIGLVGPNGAGKTTLFSLILRDDEPDDGIVTMQRGCTLGYLPQESAPVGKESVLALATGRPAAFDESEDVEVDYQADLDAQGREPKAKRILSGLGFLETDFDREARTFSGGWVMRAHLARLLVVEPDILMLDEPTNHLDLEALQWFQSYLKGYPGAFVVISHDREFLNALTNGIVEIRNSRLHKYSGNYDSYVTERQARVAQQLAAYENQQKEIKKLQEFADRFRAKASKASQAQSKLKQIDRMEKLEPPEPDAAVVNFRFPQPARSGQRVIELKNVEQAYGDHVVYSGLHFEVERGSRMVLVGPNGAGKSTLLKILADVIPIRSGERSPGHNVKVGYYAQYRTEMLDTSRSVLEEARAGAQSGMSEEFVRTVLGAFLFRGDAVFKPVRVLSGGEKSRLAIVKLLLDPPNLLLMDEPTTHLDIPSIDALIAALKQFEGTVVFISHDVYFIRAIARSVVHVQNGNLKLYPGDYQYFLDKTRATSERGALVSGNPDLTPSNGGPSVATAPPQRQKIFKTREEKRAESLQRQEIAAKRRSVLEKVQKLEAEVLHLETQEKELTTRLEDPATYDNPALALQINRELTAVSDGLERATNEWESAAEALAAFDAKA